MDSCQMPFLKAKSRVPHARQCDKRPTCRSVGKRILNFANRPCGLQIIRPRIHIPLFTNESELKLNNNSPLITSKIDVENPEIRQRLIPEVSIIFPGH